MAADLNDHQSNEEYMAAVAKAKEAQVAFNKATKACEDIGIIVSLNIHPEYSYHVQMHCALPLT